MKHLTLIAAAGSLAAFAAPVQAAELTKSGFGPLAEHTVLITDLNAPYRFDDDDWDDDDYRDRRRYRNYDRYGRYREPRRIHRRDRIWRGRDGRYYCKRGNGTTGLVVGAGVGALIGRTIDTRGDRTVGTLLGGALGAVIGREIDRGELRCR